MAPLNLSAQEMDSDGTMTGSDRTATQQCRRPYDILSKFEFSSIILLTDTRSLYSFDITALNQIKHLKIDFATIVKMKH